MDRHYPSVSRSRDARRHRFYHPVDRLVAAHAQNCRAEDSIGVESLSTTTLMKPRVSPLIASPNDDEARAQCVEFKQSCVGQRPYLIDAGEFGDGRAAADIDEETIGLEHIVADTDAGRRQEVGLTHDEGAVRHAAQPALNARSGVTNDLVLAGHDGGEIDANRPGAQAEVAGAPREVSRVGAGDGGLSCRAARIDAGAADELALDDCDRLAGRGDPAGHRRPGLAGADHYRVEAAVHRGYNLLADTQRITSSLRKPRPSGP